MSCEEAKQVLDNVQHFFRYFKRHLENFKNKGDENSFKRAEGYKKIIEYNIERLRKGIEFSPGHYRVFVGYEPVPPYLQLNGEDFDFARKTWDQSEHIFEEAFVQVSPGEKIFFVKHFGKEMKSDEVVAWAQANGYHVATLQEILAFAKAQPDLQRGYWIVGLGTYVDDEATREQLVPTLGGNLSERQLGDPAYDSSWKPERRFLLVRD